jgi:transglutaminase-like putative cysteine protease
MPAAALPARTPPPPFCLPGAARAGESSRLKIDCMLAYELDGDCEFMFLIHPVRHPCQTLVQEQLRLEPGVAHRVFIDMHSGNRVLRLRAGAGPLQLNYSAVVARHVDDVDRAAPQWPVNELPDDMLRYLLPTRYCESDLLGPVAQQLFAGLPGGHARVSAICEWVREHVQYRIGSTTATSTARDVFVQRCGVCRDLAHLAVTFCRALNIPARLVSAYAAFPDPPPDFHAVIEAYLGGRWVLFDPSGMAPVAQVVRLATGPDAKDVAFATIFGPARMVAMSPEVVRLDAAAAPVAMHALAPAP